MCEYTKAGQREEGREMKPLIFIAIQSLVFMYLQHFVTTQDQGFNQSSDVSGVERRKREMINISNFFNQVLIGYDKKLRPNAGGKPVEVQVEFKVVTLGEINEASMEFSIDIFFRQWWHEPRFKYNYTESFTMSEDAGEMFWIPDTYFINAKKSNFHKVTKENARIILDPSGDIYYSVRVTLVVQCNMDLQMYPMDTQDCPLYIESYAYTSDDIIYKWTSRETNGIEIISSETAQFVLVEARTKKIAKMKISGHFSQLIATFSFKRRLEYFIITVATPTVILVILSWCCFWIVPDAIPARISLSVTTILSTLLLSGTVNAQMPKVSYMKAIDVFILGNFAFIFLSLVEYVVVLNTSPCCPFNCRLLRKLCCCYERKSSSDKYEAASNNHVIEKRCNDHHQSSDRRSLQQSNERMYMCDMTGFEWGTSSVNYHPKGHYIDKVSRVIFPLAYVIFLNIYWFYYYLQAKERQATPVVIMF